MSQAGEKHPSILHVSEAGTICTSVARRAVPNPESVNRTTQHEHNLMTPLGPIRPDLASKVSTRAGSLGSSSSSDSCESRVFEAVGGVGRLGFRDEGSLSERLVKLV